MLLPLIQIWHDGCVNVVPMFKDDESINGFACSMSILSFLIFLTYCALSLLRMALSVAALREGDVHSSSPCKAVQHSNTHPHFYAHPQTLLSRIILLGCNMTPECSL